MSNLKPKRRLTAEEFAALEAVADKPTQHTISDELRKRLIAAGYIREVARHSGSVYALVPTGLGLRQLRDWSNGSVPSFENVSRKKDVRSKKNR